MIFGAHMSTSGGVWRALERAKSAGAEACQIFVKSNMRWLGKPFGSEDVRQWQEGLAACGIRHVFGHTGYLINVAGPDSEIRDKSLESLVHEIELASCLGLPFLVMHPGAHMGKGEGTGIRQAAQGLSQVFAATRRSKVRVALENTAGQGTCLGCELAHIARIYDACDFSDRLAVCIDTAHLFAAGRDIRSRKGWDSAVAELKDLVGLQQIVAFHLNDSKTPLGSRVDRHAHIGEGHIGVEGFRHITNDPRFAKHPGCLETPKSEDLREDIENLAVLRSLVRTKRTVKRRPRTGYA